jgi:glutamine synthetase
MDDLRDHLLLSYGELQDKNLESKEKRSRYPRFDPDEAADHYTAYLKDEPRIKAVTVCFTDIEGKFHMLDYDKEFIMNASNFLSFDGSSVRGFAEVSESDLQLKIDWSSFYWLPADVFGPGKVLVFSDIYTNTGEPHPSDYRSGLRQYCDDLYKKGKQMVRAANEVEGILVKGANAERRFVEEDGFELASSGGYYNSLPQDILRQFIDRTAEAQRAMGFENEKDHPEVAPSQFELNYQASDVVIASDQVQLYKLTARQVAQQLDMTATFLPKPMMGINGSGMHTNISIHSNGDNLFYDEKDENHTSKIAYEFAERILESASDISLILNPSVNAYRRLDPNYEAPNQIKMSAVDRTAMVRLPLGNSRSARLEVRSVSPDVNPYLLYYVLLRTGLEGPKPKKSSSQRQRTRTLPGNIIDALRVFKNGSYVTELMGEESKQKYVDLKQASANRCPKDLGTRVKRGEVLYHHEVTNQYIWSRF